ncbi:MAG: hypothetical protein AAF483_04930 [Planctomycetota bacterium]
MPQESQETPENVEPPYVPPTGGLMAPPRPPAMWPFVVGGGVLGFLIPMLGIPFMVFVLDMGPNLATRIELIDSMLYSISGPLSIVLVAIYWGVLGAGIGIVLGTFSGLLGRVLHRKKKH